MNYFSRLAQRSGIAPPRSTVAPVAAQAAPQTLPPAEVAAIEQVIEVAAPVPPSPPANAAAPFQQVTPSPATPAATRHAMGHDAAAPAPPGQTATATDQRPPRAQEDVVDVNMPVRPHAPARETPPPGLWQVARDASLSQVRTDCPSNSKAPFRQDPAPTPATDVALEVEVFAQAGSSPARSTDVTRQAPASREWRATSASSDPRLAEPVPPIDEDIVIATRTVSTNLRGKDESNTTVRQLDRAPTVERRSRPEERTRGGPVEVRVGTVTLQVHAAPPAAPARNGFAPHRHYLRLW